jgi:tripartite-type tricarboxylate transporter receptor subunit TctC
MRRLLVLGLAALTLAAGAALAQPYPARPVRVIVPFTPGGVTDVIARTVGAKLAAAWDQPVVVENRPGAGGSVGAALVARAPADGYLLLVHSSGYAINAAANPKLPRPASPASSSRSGTACSRRPARRRRSWRASTAR